MSLQTIFAAAHEHPDKPAVVYNGHAITYSGFAGAIGSTYRYLEAEDLSAGRTVVVIIYTLVDSWVTVLALQALGLNTVCVQSLSMVEALGINDVAGVVTTTVEFPKHQLEHNAGNRIIVIPDPVYNGAHWPEVSGLKVKGTIGGHILYTSGTTGHYKKLLLDGNLQLRRDAERIESTSLYSADTVYHLTSFGLWTAAGYRNPPTTWKAGGCIIFDQRQEWYRHFLQSAMTHAILIPDMVQQLLNFIGDQSSTTPPMDFHLMVTSGFLSRSLAERIINHVTRQLENMYGCTEVYIPFLRSIVTNLDELHWLSTTEYRKVEIVDEAGNICPTDVEGQLRVRLEETDCYSYLGDQQASEKMFRSGYFYPGDMAVQRADGRIRILGRSDDVINLRGQKISIAPMELAIQDRLGVDAVCLFSNVSPAGEVEVMVAIQAERWPEQSDLTNIGREFAQFDRIQFALVRQFPRTQTGTSKINRIALRKMVFPAN